MAAIHTTTLAAKLKIIGQQRKTLCANAIPRNIGIEISVDWICYIETGHEFELQCVAVIARSVFIKKKSQNTPHISPVRPRFGVPFVGLVSNWYSASIPAIMYVICCYMGTRYTCTGLFIHWMSTQLKVESDSGGNDEAYLVTDRNSLRRSRILFSKFITNDRRH